MHMGSYGETNHIQVESGHNDGDDKKEMQHRIHKLHDEGNSGNKNPTKNTYWRHGRQSHLEGGGGWGVVTDMGRIETVRTETAV